MARHYVSPRFPASPDELAAVLADPVQCAEMFGSTPEQWQAFAASLKPVAGFRRPARGNARDALYMPAAAGAYLDGAYAGIGDFASASVYDRSRVTSLQNVLQERVPSQGGFLVPELLRSDMLLATLEEAIIRPLAAVIPVTTLRTGLPLVDDTSHASSVLGGWNFAWTEESAALSISTPTYGRLFWEAKKLTAYTGGVPNELVADADALQAFLMITAPMALAWAEDNAFIQGSGTGQPQGVLNAPCAIPVTRAASSKVGMTDILSMLTRILPQSMKHFIWLCSPDVLQQILQAFFNFGSATTGVVPPPTWLMATPNDGWTLLGRPLISTEHCPALGTKGDLMAVDPRFYVIADRLNMELHSSALGQKFQQDQTEYRFRSRVDGKIWPQTAITPENSSASVSPVVILN